MKLKNIFSLYNIGDTCTGALSSINALSSKRLESAGVVKISDRQNPVLLLNDGTPRTGPSHSEQWVFMGFGVGKSCGEVEGVEE